MSTAKPGSRWNLMGNVVQRSSTILRPTTPSRSPSYQGPSSQEGRDSDAVSLMSLEISTTPLRPPSRSGVSVSPIDRSPAQVEAASVVAAATIGPSSLTQDTSMINPEPVQAPEEPPASPTGYIPPPLVNSTKGNPGAFPEEPQASPAGCITTLDSRNAPINEEIGMRNAGPALIIGACTCLAAVIVLRASVTFLSLPGLDSIARIVGFVAILFASFSMASTSVAIFRHKADMRNFSYVGREGLAVTKRTLVMSRPIVFLSCSIIGLITGVVLCSIRGVTFVDPHLTRSHFGDYTKWTVTGLGGALAGILTMSFLLLRR